MKVSTSSSRPGQARNCQHLQVAHLHGTREAYVADRCRCEACTVANRVAGRARRTALAHGTWMPYVNSAATRHHLERLSQRGMSAAQIAASTGVARSTVLRLLAEREPVRIRQSTQTALLALPVASRRSAHLVDAGTARHQVARLIEQGWSLPQLAAEFHRSPTSLRRTLRSKLITPATAEAIGASYGRLDGSRPCAGRAVRAA